MNTPNLITLGRALIVPIVFWLVIDGHDAAAFFLFVIAGISDGVDGYLARRYNQRTELGAYLDPLADKLLLVSIFIGLGIRGDLPSWLVIAAVARDALILLAVILSSLLRKPVEIAPLMVSKLNTVAQIVLAAFVLADEAFNLSLGVLRIGLIWLTAALTVVSLLAYLRNWLKHMSQDQARQASIRAANLRGNKDMQIERQAFFWLLVAIVFFFLIDQLKEILLPFVVGMGFAYALNPIADWLESKGVSRLIASIILVGCLVIFFALLIIFLVPVIVDQVRQLAEVLPTEGPRLRAIIENFARENLGPAFPEADESIAKALNWVSENSDTVASWAAASLWTQGRALFAIISLLLIAPLVAFYLLVDWKRMLSEIDGALPREHAPTLRAMGHDINSSVGAFIRGQGLVCLTLAIFYALGLWLIGLDYGLLVGFATGLMAFVPFLGWIVGTITATTLAVIQFWPHSLPVILVVCVFLAGQGLDAGFLSPKIVGPKIGLHPVWLIFALFAFSYLFGLVGTLVAVPMAAAVGVIVRYTLRAYRQSTVYTGQKPEIETPQR